MRIPENAENNRLTETIIIWIFQAHESKKIPADHFHFPGPRPFFPQVSSSGVVYQEIFVVVRFREIDLSDNRNKSAGSQTLEKGQIGYREPKDVIFLVLIFIPGPPPRLSWGSLPDFLSIEMNLS